MTKNCRLQLLTDNAHDGALRQVFLPACVMHTDIQQRGHSGEATAGPGASAGASGTALSGARTTSSRTGTGGRMGYRLAT